MEMVTKMNEHSGTTKSPNKKVIDIITSYGITIRPEWKFSMSNNKARVFTKEAEELKNWFSISEKHCTIGLKVCDLTGEERLSNSFLRTYGKKGTKKIIIEKEQFKELLKTKRIKSDNKYANGYYIIEYNGIILGRARIANNYIVLEGA